MQTPNYRVNPSLLNKFSDCLNAEKLWDEYYGSSEDPAISVEEFEAKQWKELLDAINRVHTEPFEAADRGTALNEAIDCILEHRKPSEGILLQSVKGPDGTLQHITARIHDFCFQFDANLILELASYFRGSACQQYCEATIDTAYGPVILYGYADYILRDVVADLKSTVKYSYGKYERGTQKLVYPWCLIEAGELQTVSGFEYTVVQVNGGNTKNPLISGNIYKEWYDYNHERAGCELRALVEQFLGWVELHRSEITHQRIFNK